MAMEENQEVPSASEGAEGEAAEGTEGEAKPSGGKKKKLIIAVILVAIIGIGAGSFIFVKKHKEEAAKEEAMKAEQQKSENIFHDLDEIIVNLNTEGKGVSFMKLKITLEMEGKPDFDAVVKMTPRIKDVFQVYLRELRPADMQGSVGIYRLREELLLRINKVIYPAKVKDILFKEVLVQ